MSPRRPRGAVQEPLDDYLDTNRPAHRKSRPGGHPTKNTTETASNKTTPNHKELHVNKSTTTTPPPAWTPVADEDGALMYLDGPSATLHGAHIFSEWNPEDGIVIRDGDGNEIAVEDLVPFAVEVLRPHSSILAARAEVAR